MLAIRMQRTGRKGHAQFRVVVQDARVTPSSGKVVAQLGYYNPHSKQTVLDKEKAEFYLGNGAQPSPRAVRLFSSEGIKLPEWVKIADATKQRSTRNAEKLRKNRPAEEAPAEEVVADAPVAEESVEVTEAPVAEAPAEEVADAPAAE